MSEEYYAAISRPNFHLHSSHIDKIVDRTIYTEDGSKEEIDVSKRVKVSHSPLPSLDKIYAFPYRRLTGSDTRHGISSF